MSIPIITVTSHPEHATKLVESAERHGWAVHVVKCEWKGFGTKLIETYNFLKAHPEIEQFVFCDAFDVVVMGGVGEFDRKVDFPEMMLVSAEKNCWPERSLQSQYHKSNGTYFNYVNSGLYYSPRQEFINIIESDMPNYTDDDQLYITKHFISKEPTIMQIDDFQEVFNSHSFIFDGEYTYNNGRVQIMGNEPIFIHSNGKTVDEKLNQMLGI